MCLQLRGVGSKRKQLLDQPDMQRLGEGGRKEGGGGCRKGGGVRRVGVGIELLDVVCILVVDE